MLSSFTQKSVINLKGAMGVVVSEVESNYLIYPSHRAKLNQFFDTNLFLLKCVLFPYYNVPIHTFPVIFFPAYETFLTLGRFRVIAEK